MSMYVRDGHYSETLRASLNMPPAPASLRKAFGIPTNSTVTKISSHTSASAVHLLLKEEEGQ